ncbi:MAG TPA: T9SS type A sorting domain-containing protein [Candidatus Cloacimonetes bacterium]|nr:T9SS type A sorting domain-containing protein [Candidatus Cloacimonadota bacterium]
MKKILFIILFYSISLFLFSQNFEGFESGDFSAYNWEFSGNSDWFISNIEPYEGLYCAQAGAIDDYESTSLSVNMETTQNGDISFFWKVSSQNHHDKLYFYIDGEEMAYIAGIFPWNEESFPLEPGDHVFTWKYEKNEEISNHSDTGWIDNITFPPTTTSENDLAVKSISGPGFVYTHDSAVYDITVKNYGTNNQNDYTLKLFQDEDVLLETIQIAETIVSEQEKIHRIVWIIPADEPTGVTYLHALLETQLDDDLENNSSSVIPVEVLPFQAVEVTVGYGNEQVNWTPFNFRFNNNLTESLYFFSEMQYTGVIYAVSYQNDFEEYLTNKQVKLWMGETYQSNLTNGWFPAGDLTSVFENSLDFPSGYNTIFIQLETPYEYTGANLIVLANRPWDDETYDINNNYHTTHSTIHPDRTLALNTNQGTINPESPPDGFLFNRIPNTTFYIAINGLGALEGYVYDDQGSPLTGADIVLEESFISAVSNSSGYYLKGNIMQGTHDFTASAFGYSPQTIEGTIIEDETTQIDFNLSPLPMIQISGHVVGSDFPGIGLEGALILLSGYGEYSLITDVTGNFTVNVYANNDYSLNIFYGGYANYTTNITVGSSDIDLGTIVLTELTFPPENVLATQNDEQTEAEIFWQPPLNSRIFESYTGYRFLEEHEDYPDLWMQIFSGLTDTTFIDYEWAGQELGTYKFAITSVYTNEIESIPGFSNSLEKVITDVENNDVGKTELVLHSYPNPFNSETTISFSCPREAENTETCPQGRIIIYNIRGQKVRVLECFNSVETKATESLFHIIWNGKDDFGTPVKSGIYFYEFTTGKKSIIKKMLLMR